MPVRWDNDARYTLLLMILSQNPGVLSSKIDAGTISKSWPRNEDLTIRAVQDQVKFFRKEVQKIQSGKGPTVPSSPSRPTGIFSSTPRKPAISTPVTVTPTKRANATTTARTTTFSAKKRKVNSKKQDSDESEVIELTSEEEAPDVHETDDDSPLSKALTITERRQLPARSKSRSRSYFVESDSDGRDAGAKDSDNGLDSDFSISKMDGEGRKKGRDPIGALLRKEMEEKDMLNGDGEQDEDLKMERVSDAESGITKRTSWQSAQEEI